MLMPSMRGLQRSGACSGGRWGQGVGAVRGGGVGGQGVGAGEGGRGCPWLAAVQCLFDTSYWAGVLVRSSSAENKIALFEWTP